MCRFVSFRSFRSFINIAFRFLSFFFFFFLLYQCHALDDWLWLAIICKYIYKFCTARLFCEPKKSKNFANILIQPWLQLTTMSVTQHIIIGNSFMLLDDFFNLFFGSSQVIPYFISWMSFKLSSLIQNTLRKCCRIEIVPKPADIHLISFFFVHHGIGIPILIYWTILESINFSVKNVQLIDRSIVV